MKKYECTYYTIEGLCKYFDEQDQIDYGGWESCTEHVANKFRYTELIASGDCWQKYNYYGTLDKERAIDILLSLKKKLLLGDKDVCLTSGSYSSDRKPYFEHVDYRIVEIKRSYEENIV